jgi:hypothetical protein
VNRRWIGVFALLVATVVGCVTGSALARPQARAAAAKTVNPCSLVTGKQAAKIVGASLSSQHEAPLGPTCIYAFKHHSAVITLALENESLAKASVTLRKPTHYTIRKRAALCGSVGGRANLFAAVSASRTLNVSASCSVARQFASVALGRLHA